ncbi:hypothetical protein N9Z27_01900 [Alphaproteobacteria bacterium]|nr:hypothetical protein [Alphaproteobacteria bacterium]
MRTDGNTSKFVPKNTSDFYIIEEFAALESARKMLLCDHLFVDGYDTFYKTVELLWPQAKYADTKKLEKFLILLKNTAH